MRQLLRQYTNAVAGPEWTKQDTGGTSDSARAAITEMYRVLGSQPPSVASSPIHGAFLSQLSVLAAARNTRILDTKPRIPPLLWSGLFFGGFVLVALTSSLRLGSTFGHAVLSGTIAVLLGLLLCVIYTLDHPSGLSGVSRPHRLHIPWRCSTESTGGHSRASLPGCRSG